MKSDYDRVTDIGKWKNRLLIASTIFTLLLTLDEKYQLSNVHKELKDYLAVLIGINTMIVTLYVLLEIRENYIFSKAERTRTLQYIDNSFGTNFAGISVSSYFTQDQLSPGFYKLSANCFENTFHSFNIAKEMQTNMYFKSAAVLAIFIFSAAVGEKGIVRYLVEAILPLSLLQNSVKLAIFVSRLDSLRETFATFFTSVRMSTFIGKEPEALKNVIEAV